MYTADTLVDIYKHKETRERENKLLSAAVHINMKCITFKNGIPFVLVLEVELMKFS